MVSIVSNWTLNYEKGTTQKTVRHYSVSCVYRIQIASLSVACSNLSASFPNSVYAKRIKCTQIRTQQTGKHHTGTGFRMFYQCIAIRVYQLREWEINPQTKSRIQLEFEPKTFWILVRRSYHSATWTPGRGAEDKLHNHHCQKTSAKFQQLILILSELDWTETSFMSTYCRHQ